MKPSSAKYWQLIKSDDKPFVYIIPSVGISRTHNKPRGKRIVAYQLMNEDAKELAITASIVFSLISFIVTIPVVITYWDDTGNFPEYWWAIPLGFLAPYVTSLIVLFLGRIYLYLLNWLTK